MTNSILADRIEQFILERLGKQSSDELLLRRKDVADLLECAPSQVTYVINTRFSSDNRFMVESRRGSGGYIKISMRGVAENYCSLPARESRTMRSPATHKAAREK